MNAGQNISAAAHVGLIAYALFGGMFMTPNDRVSVAVQEVSILSEAEFSALSPSNTAPDVSEISPEPTAPQIDSLPETTPIEDAAPEAIIPDVPPVARPDVPPETLPDVPVAPQAEVIDRAPEQPVEPEISLEDPGANIPDSSDPPTPRPVPRIADTAVATPDSVPDIAPTPTPAVSADADTADVAEEAQPEAAPEAATTEIITEADRPAGVSTSPRPRSRPASVARQVQERQAEVSAQSVADAAAEAATNLAASTPSDTASAPDRPTGPPLTSGERDDMRVAVGTCWNTGAMSTDAMRTVITVAVSMNQDGTPQSGSITLIGHSGGTEAGARAGFEVARRAILRCGARGFNLPLEKYDHWRNIEMTFDPEQMRFR